MAVPSSLKSLVEDGIIDDVERQLMSGKEAAVYIVRYRGEAVAAKVYKAREQRTFKANAAYTEGRNQTRNTRDKRAMSKRSSYGRELNESSWRDMEYSALWSAAHAGVRVPKPIMLYEDVLLMELLVDAEGFPASRLADFEIAPDQAEPLHLEIFTQVRLLLGTGKVHGDLSAFNVLMAKAGPTLIDLPQVVDAAQNNMAGAILRRDLENVTQHLARFDARLLRFRSCGDGLWQAFQQGRLAEATHPQVGAVRGERASGGRRAALAETGRMGREGRRPQQGPGAFERGAPRGSGPEVRPQRGHEQHVHEQRPQSPQRSDEQQRGHEQRAQGPQRSHEQHGHEQRAQGPQRGHEQRGHEQRGHEQRAQGPQRGHEQRAQCPQRGHEQHAYEQRGPRPQTQRAHEPRAQGSQHTQQRPHEARAQGPQGAHEPRPQQAQRQPETRQRTHEQRPQAQQTQPRAYEQQRPQQAPRAHEQRRTEDRRRSPQHARRDEQERQPPTEGRAERRPDRDAPIPVDYVRRSSGRQR